MARYFVYTDSGWTKPTNTPHGTQSKIVISQQPIWNAFLEGINQPFSGPVPAPGYSPEEMKHLPHDEEADLLVNAATGEWYTTEIWRSGLTGDVTSTPR